MATFQIKEKPAQSSSLDTDMLLMQDAANTTRKVTPLTLWSYFRAKIMGDTSVSLWIPMSTLTVTTADVTVSDNRSTAYILLGVLTGNRNVIFPADVKEYMIINNCTGAFFITVKTASGIGVVVNPGESVQVYCDSVNMNRSADKAASLSETNDLTKTVKIKKLTGTTASTQGASAAVAHGLTGGKIISVTVTVAHGTNQGMMPGQLTNAGYQYDLNFDSVNISVNNISGNSGNILSKPFIVTILYEA